MEVEAGHAYKHSLVPKTFAESSQQWPGVLYRCWGDSRTVLLLVECSGKIINRFGLHLANDFVRSGTAQQCSMEPREVLSSSSLLDKFGQRTCGQTLGCRRGCYRWCGCLLRIPILLFIQCRLIRRQLLAPVCPSCVLPLPAESTVLPTRKQEVSGNRSHWELPSADGTSVQMSQFLSPLDGITLRPAFPTVS